jgi:hypothetical protein
VVGYIRCDGTDTRPVNYAATAESSIQKYRDFAWCASVGDFIGTMELDDLPETLITISNSRYGLTAISDR